MRNLKKLLALVLAMVMAFSLMLSASAANGDYDKYTDKETITEEFQTAVNVLSGLDVLKGDGPDDAKTFRPADTLTRAEAAVIVYRVATGDVTDQQTALYADYNHFADVSKDDWFAGYVGFCQNAGIIKGTTPTTFSPYEKVSGYQLLAMLLRVIGYGKNNEFTGTNWQVNTAAMAESLRLTDTVKEANFASTLNRDARRDVVAELTFRTMILPATVTYTPSLAYNEYTTIGGTEKNPTQGYKIFRLVEKPVVLEDDWGRPNDTWYCDGVNSMNKQYDKTPDKIVAEVTWTPVATYNTAKTECDIIHENTGWSGDKDKSVSSAYLNGVKVTATNRTAGQSGTANNTIEALGTSVQLGAQGRILEIYDMTKSFNYGDGQTATETGARIVEIDTWLARVDRVTAAGTDVNGHPTKATVDLTVYAAEHAEHSNRDALKQNNTTESCPVGHTANGNVANGSTDTWDFDKVEAEGFSVGDYVLVYINQDMSETDDLTDDPRYAYSNKYKISGIDIVNEDETSNLKKAEIKAGGYVRSWTDGVNVSTANKLGAGHNTDVTFIGTTQFNDAEKFCANWRVKDIPWSVAVDRYGNAIGLVQFTQYLTIEKLEWKHGSAFGDDFALADLLLASGEKISSATVSMVNNKKLTNTTDDYGLLAVMDKDSNATDTTLHGKYRTVGTVSDHYTNNNDYYRHIFSYAVNEDGTYSLGTDLGWEVDTTTYTARDHFNASKPDDLTTVTITRGEATIYGTDNTGTGTANINTYTATDNTVFALLNADGYTYTVYTGKNNVPTLTATLACVMVGESGYADFVVLSGINLAGNTFLGYVTDINADGGKYIGGKYVDGFNVYRLGEATPTMVYSDDVATELTAGFSEGTGLYLISVDSNNELTGAIGLTATISGTTYTWGADDNAASASLAERDIPSTGSGYNWLNSDSYMARVAIKRGASGNSFMAEKYTNAVKDATKFNGYSYTPNGKLFDLNVTDDTKIIVVNKSTLDGASAGTYLTAGTVADITDESIAYITYNTKNVSTGAVSATIYNAETIYVYKLSNNVKLYKAVDTNAKLNVEGSTIANGLPGYMNVDGTPEQALKAAEANPYEVSIADIQGRVGATGHGWAFTKSPLNGDFAIDDTTTAATYFKISYYTGTQKIVPADEVDLGANTTTTGNLTVSEGDKLLMTWQIGADSDPATYYVYTVIKLTK